MNKLLWLLVGIAGGFVLAHLVDKDPRGHEMLADIDARITGFTELVGDTYRSEGARLATFETSSAAAAGRPEASASA